MLLLLALFAELRVDKVWVGKLEKTLGTADTFSLSWLMQ